MKKGCEKFWVLVLLAILIVLILQLIVVMNQRDILKNSLVPNKPMVSIFSPSYFINLNYNLLVQGHTLALHNVGVLNIGKTSIPYANISLDDTKYFEDQSSSAYEIENLTEMESEKIFGPFQFKLKQEIIDSFEPGVYPLKFKIHCPICEEVFSHDSFDICIYETSPLVDCGPDWEW